ncbi:hypothetical protein K431DRAFT_165132 [Polychaeton citri CBS 116435]|uniref:Uncharacterized protein n=1 Tax=Polychaeton citri CBS 116435 TaxID=1314669 RepID=A0A9P4QEC2_9PEZI|nr:hypothetical protein K431DRAFT_165132 [Polychaeton citri CBS 116435]
MGFCSAQSTRQGSATMMFRAGRREGWYRTSTLALALDTRGNAGGVLAGTWPRSCRYAQAIGLRHLVGRKTKTASVQRCRRSRVPAVALLSDWLSWAPSKGTDVSSCQPTSRRSQRAYLAWSCRSHRILIGAHTKMPLSLCVSLTDTHTHTYAFGQGSPTLPPVGALVCLPATFCRVAVCTPGPDCRRAVSDNGTSLRDTALHSKECQRLC